MSDVGNGSQNYGLSTIFKKGLSNWKSFFGSTTMVFCWFIKSNFSLILVLFQFVIFYWRFAKTIRLQSFLNFLQPMSWWRNYNVMENQDRKNWTCAGTNHFQKSWNQRCWEMTHPVMTHPVQTSHIFFLSVTISSKTNKWIIKVLWTNAVHWKISSRSWLVIQYTGERNIVDREWW